MKYFFIFYIIFSMLCFNGCNQKKADAPGKVATSQTTEKGAQIFNTCVTCHGKNAEGMLSLGAPSIARQEDWYMIRQIKYFRDGIRGTHPEDIKGATMLPMVKSLSDKDIEEVVHHIKNLPVTPVSTTISGDIENGKSIYNRLCITCHGANAEGDRNLNSPRLTGLQDWYIKTQILHYLNGIRGTHPDDSFGPQMMPMVKQLKDENEVNDVVAYIATLHSI